jgi:hypothetical protein
MIYLKTSEVAAYARKIEIDDDQLTAVVLDASLAVDAYLQRSLAIARQTRRIWLNAGLAGSLPRVPITDVYSVRFRPLLDVIGGGYAPPLGSWQTVDEDSLEDVVDRVSGTVALDRVPFSDTDFGRVGYSLRRTRRYECEVDYASGYLAHSTAKAAASAGDETIEPDSVEYFAEGVKVTVGDSTTVYEIVGMLGTRLEVSPALEAEVAIGDEISEVVPKDVRRACGLIIEDEETYLPNAARQSEKLDVLTDTVERRNSYPIPSRAVQLLQKYKG